MQVAVAGVAEAEGDQVVAPPDGDRLLDRLCEAVERHDDVLAEGAAAPGAHGEGEAGAPPPQRLEPLAVARGVDGDRVLRQGLDELVANALGLVGRPVGLGDHHERGTVRDARLVRGSAGGERLDVEVLDRSRSNAVPEDAEDRLAARGRAAVERDDGQGHLRGREQLQPRRRDDAERALGADEEALQVIAGDVFPDRPADGHELARSEHGLEAGDPGAGGAVLERVRSGRVRRDVAADLRQLGRARIRSEEEAALADPALQGRGRHAGLD